MVIVALAVIVGVLASLGAGMQEAFQVILTSANVCYAINYLLMFAVPLAASARFGRPRRHEIAPGAVQEWPRTHAR